MVRCIRGVISCDVEGGGAALAVLADEYA
jgi:hypothetical protein